LTPYHESASTTAFITDTADIDGSHLPQRRNEDSRNHSRPLDTSDVVAATVERTNVLFADCEAGLPLDLFSLALSQAHPRATAIVIDELDTCNFQGASDHFESCSTGLG
jgi:hypothetical protein